MQLAHHARTEAHVYDRQLLHRRHFAHRHFAGPAAVLQAVVGKREKMQVRNRAVVGQWRRENVRHLRLEGDVARPGDGGASPAVDGLRYGHVVHLMLLAW
jgi:hypothetical protein